MGRERLPKSDLQNKLAGIPRAVDKLFTRVAKKGSVWILPMLFTEYITQFANEILPE